MARSMAAGTAGRVARTLRGRLGHEPDDDGLRGGTGVGRLAGEHLVGDGAERVLVGAGVEGAIAGGLLGAHVVWRAEGEPGLGDATAAGVGDGEGDAEVGDDRLPGLEQDVLGLQVAVDDAAGVGVVEGAGEEGGEAHGFIHRQLSLACQACAQGLAARHTASRSTATPVVSSGVEQRQQVGVLKVGGDLDLGEEALGADDGPEFGLEDLDGDEAIVLEVVREVDGGHAALPELALNAVAVGQGLREAVERRHFGCAGKNRSGSRL